MFIKTVDEVQFIYFWCFHGIDLYICMVVQLQPIGNWRNLTSIQVPLPSRLLTIIVTSPCFFNIHTLSIILEHVNIFGFGHKILLNKLINSKILICFISIFTYSEGFTLPWLSFSLKIFLQLFLKDRSACSELSQFSFTSECVYFSFILEEDFSGYIILD